MKRRSSAESRALSIFEAAAEGERRKDRAIERVDKANEYWVTKACEVARRIASERKPASDRIERYITADDIYPHMGGLVPTEPKAMGAVMTRLQREGLIEATDRTVKSCRPECHRRPIRVWRVL